MATFAEELRSEYPPEARNLGGNANRAMRKALQSIRSRNLNVFRGYVVLVVVILLIYITIVVVYTQGDPTKLAGATGAFGLASWKPFEFLLKAWDKWGKSELMMALIEGATSEQIQEMFNKIAALP